MRTVLVLEDENTISEFVEINLKRAGYHVIVESTGEDALKTIEKNREIDIAILDVMLPGIDGFEVCRRIRQNNRNMGIIMLTARTQEMDKVTGLMIGADDYVPKPFSPAELVARVDSLYRRIESSGENKKDILISGEFELNKLSRTLSKAGRALELTQVEYLIVKYFIENRNTALSRESIFEEVWGADYQSELKIVDVNIRRLRMKIEDDPANPRYIRTVWGYGYKWGI